MVMTPAIIGTLDGAAFDASRFNVYWVDFDNKLMAQYSKYWLLDLTLHALTLGDQDATTGWYTPSYTASTVEGYMFPKGSSWDPMSPGVYVQYDVLLITADPVLAGDYIEDAAENLFKVMSSEETWIGDSFVKRDCQLQRTMGAIEDK